MRVRKALVVVVALVLLGAASAVAPPAVQAQAQSAPVAQGLVVLESTQSFEATWSALIDALNANPNIRLIAQVDHGAAAAGAGLSLEGNRVAFFGNPSLGTPVMQASRSAGIDLPQKMQVFEQDGRVYVAYNPASYLEARHGAGAAATLPTINGALANLARTATNTEGPVSAPSSVGAGAGLVSTDSPNDFETTWSQLVAAIDNSPASIAFTVDHGQNSGGALGPTRLVVFGNPNIGTPLMADSPTAGIDLPLKMLVAEADDGTVQVISTSPSFVQQRHGIGPVATIGGATTAISNFTAAAVAADATAETATGAGDGDEVLGVSELAFTGTDAGAASFAITLLATGGVLVVGARRRIRE